MTSATSRLAMASAVGILLSLSSAKAADLGGNCCADLEERVAELEATTVRKGNRKVSLTLTGQIDKEIMYYRDDVRSRTIAGVDNINSSTRFFFTGDAKISSSVKAGFEMMVEWAGQTRSDTMTQLGPTTNQYFTGVGNAGATQLRIPTLIEPSGDSALAVRTANWWLEDTRLGRITVGRVNIQGPASTIDVSGGDLNLVAWNNIYLQGGGFWLQRTDTTQLSTTNVQGISGWCYGCSRAEGIRWDSPSIGGLLLGAYWGQQDRFTAQARYANEFNGVQVAAGAGYQHDNQLGYEDPGLTTASRTDVEQQGYALSVKHVASGLFIQGSYGQTHWKLLNNST
ncbi:MAG: porin, partial [Hyphomicrobiales bacterium]